MNLFDGNGNKITTGGSLQGQITPSDTTFFDIEYPNYSNLYDGTYSVGGIKGDGTVNTSQTSCFVSDFIKTSGGAYLCPGTRSELTVNPEEVASVSCGCVYLAFYDSDKTFISLTTRPTMPVRIPENTVYCRVSWQPYSMDGLDTSGYFVGIVDSADSNPTWERYYKPGAVKSAYLSHDNLSYTDKPLHNGKRWLLFGDSLTDSYGGHDWQESTSPVGGDGWKDTSDRIPWTGYFWASKIARELGLVLDNRAKSGSNINVGSNGNYADVCGINILNAFLSEIDAGAEPPDYITIHFGSNAITSQLGTSSDTSEDTNTVCGAVKYFIEKLRTNCPNTVIGFVLPPQSDWGGNSTVKSVKQGHDAIESVLSLEDYAAPYVDMWKESGITVSMLPDGIHVSSKQANNLYYHAMRRFMIGL